MAQYLPLPDGSSVTIREGETPRDAWVRAQRMYPEAFGAAPTAEEGQPASGFTPALKSGFSELKSGLAALAGRTGIMDQAAAERYIQEQEEYQKRTFKPTATFGEAPVTKTLELLGGSLPYMAAPIVAGGVAATAPVSAPVATALGLGAAGAASATQFTGSNLRRQMEEGKTLGETELGAAALAAVPQAALDALSFKMLPGVRQILTAAGKEVSPAVAKRIAEQGVREVAKDYALATGKAMGTEGLTEVGQQFLERLQAGLSISDARARDEYLDSLIGGAVLGGVISPAGRYVERRGEAAKQEGERLAKARETQAEEDAAREAAAAFRKTPEGQQQFVQEYEARQARWKELGAVPKPGKDATPLERAQYAEVGKERKALSDQLKREAGEYIAAKKSLGTSGLTPEQLAAAETRQAELEAQGGGEEQREPYYYQPQQGLPGFGNAPAAETPAEQEAVDYAAQIRNLNARLDDLRTQAQSTTDLAQKLELGRQYEQVQTALTEATRLQKAQGPAKSPEDKIAALRKRMAKAEEEGDIPAQVKIANQLQELGVTNLEEVTVPEQAAFPLFPQTPKVESKESFAARVYKPGPLDIEAQEQEALAEAERQREEAAKEAERERKIAPEKLALQRIAEKPAPTVKQGQVSGLVDRLVNAALRSDGKAPGRTIVGAGATEVLKADELRGQLAVARATDNEALANNLIEQLKALKEPETEKAAGDLEVGEAAKGAGVEGRLSAQAIMDNRVTRLSQSQLGAYDRLVDFLQTVRESDQNVAEAKKETLKAAAEKLKDTVVGLALNEMDARRAQAGLAPLTQAQQVAAIGRINGLLNELISRSAGLFNVQETPAVTRGTLTLKSAKEGPPPAGKRLFGNMDMAANTLRGQMRNVMDEIGEIKAPPPVVREKPKARVQPDRLREELTGYERDVRKQFTDAYDRAKSDEDYRKLKEMEQAFDRLSPVAQEEALLQARRVATGNPLEIERTLAQELAEYKQAGQSDAVSQGELFTGASEKGEFRATPANFMRYLDSGEVRSKLAAIDAKRKKLEVQIKASEAKAAAAKAEIEKTDKFLSNMAKATPTTARGVAEQKLKAALTQGTPLVRAATLVQMERERAIEKIRKPLEDIKETRKKLQAQLDQLGKDYAFITERLAVNEKNKPTIEAVKRVDAQLTAVENLLKSANEAYEVTRAEYQALLEKHATDTVENSLIRKGAAAQARIDKAQAELRAAEAEEATARAKLAEAQRAEKQSATGDVTLVYRDTSAPEVQVKVAALRKLIGKAEEAHAKAQLSGDEKAMEAAIKEIETSYDKLYEVLNNAPVVREDRMSPVEARAVEEFEKAQRASVDKAMEAAMEMLQRRFDKALERAKAAPRIEPAMKMTERRTVASVKNVKSGRIETQFKQESVAQQEKRAKEEATTGKYPARALEELAKARAELKEVQDQIAYIDANPAEPRSAAKAKQTAARAAAVAKRKALEAKVKNLSAAQREVMAEARVEKQAEKTLKQERRKMLRNEDIFPAGPSSYALDRVRYEGSSWMNHPDETTGSVLYDVLSEVGDKAPGPNNLSSAIARVRQTYKDDIALFKSNPSAAAPIEAKLAVLNTLRIENFLIAKATRPEKVAPARRVERVVSLPTKPAAPVGPEALAARFKTEIATDAPFNGMTFAEAARYGAKRTTSPMVRQLFDRLAEVFDAAPEQFAGKVYATTGPSTIEGRLAAGLYAGGTNEILVVAPGVRSGQANKTLLHELTHAATVYALNMSPELNAQVEALRLKVVDWLETPAGRAYFRKHSMGLGKNRQSIYGLKNTKEFLSELFSDREFQKMLTQIPSNKPRKHILTRFVEALAKFFDAPGEAGQSLFAEAVALTDEIFNFTVREVYNTPSIQQVAAGDYDVQPLLLQKPRYASAEMERLGRDTDKFVAKQKTFWEKIKANTTGLAFETQLVDRFAGFERLAKYMDALKGSQMMYYLRMYDQRMNFTAQSVANGAPVITEKTRADGRKEYVLESKAGPSIKGVVETLAKAQPMVGNAEAVNRTFTLYLAALRADRVGLAALNFGKDVTQETLDNAKRAVANTPGLQEVFDKARSEYNAYNRNLMNFLAETGALSEGVAKRLSETNDYIPFYREQNGNAMLIIGGENPIRIGSIAEQPYLQELVGGDTAILDFMTSSVQNTNMLVDMGLRNLATKNAIFELINLNAAKIVKGQPSGADVVKFKVNGEDRYAVVDTETVTVGGQRFNTGIPAELLVKGMEGIPTQMPALLRAMAMPSQLLRKAVTLSPVYMAKQLFRDSLAAPIVSGADFTPVFGALRQLKGEAKPILEARGITGGQYLSGTSEDMAKILRDIGSGKPGWMSALSKVEALGMEADALTRRAQYNSYIQQGMSEMEATLMALESMNFNKRGASPSVHMANALIPFMNAQIQGLNVLYKAFTGKMPFNDKLKLRQKLLLRGGMLAAASLLYAAMMEDDETYKNATPDQKYGNWFVKVPGVDEAVRVPVPFEIGYIFKALPEALYNSMTTEHGGEEAVKAFKQILLQTVPGGSSYGLPQALKPAIEVGLGKSFYTGRDILSAREKELLPEEQFRANTSEIAKAVGKSLGISPVNMEYLVRGYTGTLGLAFLHALSLGAPKSESPEAAAKRLSDYPLIGGTFQPADAGGVINSVYERFNEDIQVRNAYKKMLTEGRTSEANELLQRRGNEIMEAEFGDTFKSNMTKLTQAERAIAASNMSPEAKRKQLDEIRRIKIGLARTYREVADKTTRQ